MYVQFGHADSMIEHLQNYLPIGQKEVGILYHSLNQSNTL